MSCCSSSSKSSHIHPIKDLFKVFKEELQHHLPIATMSVAMAIMIISFINVFFEHGIVACTVADMHSMTDHVHDSCNHTSGMDVLFHSFHFIHILFATSGTMLTFYRYSNSKFLGVFIGAISALVFCTFSDILLPYTAGSLLGVNMDLHICFSSELSNVLPFLFIGLLNGVIMSKSEKFLTEENSLFLHFWHTFISALASIFYALGHGLPNYYDHFGLFFLLMIVAVVLPCTLSDVVAPILFARMIQKK